LKLFSPKSSGLKNTFTLDAMADDHPNGYLKFGRAPIGYRDPTTRIRDYNEIYAPE
jgi:hypothetical protein